MKVFAILVLCTVVKLVVGQTLTNPSICDVYVPSLAPNESTLLNNFAAQMRGDLFGTPSMQPFFNGSINGTTDFVTNATNRARLETRWSQFFGSNKIMNCTDSNFPAFTGNSNLTQVHQHLPIGAAEFSQYVRTVVDSSAFSSYQKADQERFRAILFSFRYQICLNKNDPKCNPGSFCDKLVIQNAQTGQTFLSAVVDNLFIQLVTNVNLKRFFDGSISGSTNYTNPANAAKIATLKSHFIQFLGSALLFECTDGSIGSYQGKSMTLAHTNLPIGPAEVTEFNTLFLDVLANHGFSVDDRNVIGSLLTTISGTSICNQAACFPPATIVDPFPDANAGSSLAASVLVLLALCIALLL